MQKIARFLGSESKRYAGSSSVFFSLPGKADRSKIEKEFKKRQKAGNKDYGGGWGTIPKLRYETWKVLESEQEAENFILEKASKWDYGIAVKYIDGNKIKPLKQKLAELEAKQIKLKNYLEKKYDDKRSWLHQQIFNPVLSPEDRAKKDKLSKSINDVKTKIRTINEKTSTWLIGGWAAD